MLDIGWPELLVVGAVALVAIGPKDLPKVMHTLGRWTGKARRAFLAIQHDFERMSFEVEQEERRKEYEATHPKNESDNKPPDEAAP